MCESNWTKIMDKNKYLVRLKKVVYKLGGDGVNWNVDSFFPPL